MPMLQNTWIRYCIIAACSTLVATGCIIERGVLTGPGYAAVAPRNYCPGDPVTASFDFLEDLRCPAGLDELCAMTSPTVAMTSEPMLFPAQSIRGYTGNVDFIAPDAPSFDVRYNPDRDEVLIPTEEFRDGNRVFVGRSSTDRLFRGTKQGPLDRVLAHDGMCAGSEPINAPQMLPGLPEFSPNLALSDLCNLNPVHVIVTLSGGAIGSPYTQILAPNQCLGDMPGVPSSTQNARMVDVRPMNMDPATRCTATGPHMPPPPLRTRVRMQCR
ncbi:MAG: hypothetical protein V4673_09455 [Pseudomonadota bacterium]